MNVSADGWMGIGATGRVATRSRLSLWLVSFYAIYIIIDIIVVVCVVCWYTNDSSSTRQGTDAASSLCSV